MIVDMSADHQNDSEGTIQTGGGGQIATTLTTDEDTTTADEKGVLNVTTIVGILCGRLTVIDKRVLPKRIRPATIATLPSGPRELRLLVLHPHLRVPMTGGNEARKAKRAKKSEQCFCAIAFLF